MTRDEALKIVMRYEKSKDPLYDEPEYLRAVGVVEGYKQGLRDSANEAKRLRMSSLEPSDLIRYKNQALRNVERNILALLEVKEKKA